MHVIYTIICFSNMAWFLKLIVESVLLTLCINCQMLLSSTSAVPDYKHVCGLHTFIGLFLYDGFIMLKIDNEADSFSLNCLMWENYAYSSCCCRRLLWPVDVPLSLSLSKFKRISCQQQELSAFFMAFCRKQCWSMSTDLGFYTVTLLNKC